MDIDDEVKEISITGLSDIVDTLQDDLIKVVKVIEDLSYVVNRLKKQFDYLDIRMDETDISIQNILKQLCNKED